MNPLDSLKRQIVSAVASSSMDRLNIRNETRAYTSQEIYSLLNHAATFGSGCTSPEGVNQTLDSWSLSDWFTATLGELGEAANIAKKLNRVRDGNPHLNSETPEELHQALQDEVADVFIYLDLLAQAAGFSLSEAVATKFNKTSKKIGHPYRIFAR